MGTRSGSWLSNVMRTRSLEVIFLSTTAPRRSSPELIDQNRHPASTDSHLLQDALITQVFCADALDDARAPVLPDLERVKRIHDVASGRQVLPGGLVELDCAFTLPPLFHHAVGLVVRCEHCIGNIRGAPFAGAGNVFVVQKSVPAAFARCWIRFLRRDLRHVSNLHVHEFEVEPASDAVGFVVTDYRIRDLAVDL